MMRNFEPQSSSVLQNYSGFSFIIYFIAQACRLPQAYKLEIMIITRLVSSRLQFLHRCLIAYSFFSYIHFRLIALTNRQMLLPPRAQPSSPRSGCFVSSSLIQLTFFQSKSELHFNNSFLHFIFFPVFSSTFITSFLPQSHRYPSSTIVIIICLYCCS